MAGITLTLTGTTSTGQNVTFTAVSGADSSYTFVNLAPRTYTVSENTNQLPSGYLSKASAGTENPGSTTVDGTNQTSSITAITLQLGDNAVNYDFLNFFVIANT
jgi:hypothetical protein